MQLLFVLLASLSCGYIAETDFVKSIISSKGYSVYGVIFASIYLIPAAFATVLASKALLNKQNKDAIGLSLLGFCMAFSGVLSLLMINFGLYYTLLSFRVNWWADTYTLIEIIIALMVGWNGFSYMVNSDYSFIFWNRFFNSGNLKYWAGKFK